MYPVPFGSVNDFFPGAHQTDTSTPQGNSIFPFHTTAVTTDGDLNIDANSEEVGPRDVIIHIRVRDPDFIGLLGKSNGIAVGEHGPVKVSVWRGGETLLLATAGGQTANRGTITVGQDIIPGVTRELGPIQPIAPDSEIFEIDLPIRYTDGPPDNRCPDTPELGYSSLNGESGVLGRFDQVPIVGDYCLLQGDILQVTYEDPIDASGEPNSVTDSATFDLRNGVLQSDKSTYGLGSDMILTLIEPDFDLDNDRAENYSFDLIEWNSDTATLTMGELGGELSAFDPEPLFFRETGDSTGIFQAVIEIPESLRGTHLARGEEIRLQYMDWGPSGADFVGQENELVNLTIFTSNFAPTIGLDQKVYSWTDKVYITVTAPDWNRNPDVVELIGHTNLNPIRVTTRNFQLDKYHLAETGTNTGIFTGELILTGFLHDADGDPNTGDESGFDTNPRTNTINGWWSH